MASNYPLLVNNDTSFQVLLDKITEPEKEVETLNRKLCGYTGSVSLSPANINDLEDEVQGIKHSGSDNNRELNSLESEVDDLKRSSHSHD